MRRVGACLGGTRAGLGWVGCLGWTLAYRFWMRILHLISMPLNSVDAATMSLASCTRISNNGGPRGRLIAGGRARRREEERRCPQHWAMEGSGGEAGSARALSMRAVPDAAHG